MKRLVIILLGITLLAGLCACSPLPVRQTMEGKFIESKADYLNYMTQLEERVEELERSDSQKSAEIGGLKNTLSQCRRDLSARNATVSELEDDISELEAEVGLLKGQTGCAYIDSFVGYYVGYPGGWRMERLGFPLTDGFVESVTIKSPGEEPSGEIAIMATKFDITPDEITYNWKMSLLKKTENLEILHEYRGLGWDRTMGYSYTQQGRSWLGTMHVLQRGEWTWTVKWTAEPPLRDICQAIAASFVALPGVD